MADERAVKVVIQQSVLHGSNDGDFLQKVATVYVNGEEYRVLAPPMAVGDALEWLDHFSVRRPEGFGSEIVVTGEYSVLAVKVVKEQLEKVRAAVANQRPPTTPRAGPVETPRPIVTVPDAIPDPPAAHESEAANIPQGWSRGEKIAAWALGITVLTFLAALLVIPEFRKFMRLDEPAPTSSPTPAPEKVSEPASTQANSGTAPASKALNPNAVLPHDATDAGKKKRRTSSGSEPDKGSGSASPGRSPQSSSTVPLGMVLPPNSVISFGQQGGITAGQVNIGSESVPPPNISWTSAELPKEAGSFSGAKITISMDKPFTNAAFIALCDRPCTSIKAVASQGFTDSVAGSSKSNPNLVVIRIDLPRVVESTDPIQWEVRSKDDQPIRITKVQAYRAQPQ